jgi:hypothetical protein
MVYFKVRANLTRPPLPPSNDALLLRGTRHAPEEKVDKEEEEAKEDRRRP